MVTRRELWAKLRREFTRQPEVSDGRLAREDGQEARQEGRQGLGLSDPDLSPGGARAAGDPSADEDQPMDGVRNSRILAQIMPILARLNTRATMELGTLLTDAYRKTRSEILRVVLLSGGPELPPEPSIAAIFNRIPSERIAATAENSLEYIKSVDADLKARIRQEMGIGLVKGDTTHEIAKRLVSAGVTEQGIKAPFYTAEIRANVIARTEAARVQAATTLEAMKQVQEVSPGWGREWCAALERVCPTCRERNGKVWAVDDKSAPTIPAHPRCRCCWVPAKLPTGGISGKQAPYNEGMELLERPLNGVHFFAKGLNVSAKDLKQVVSGIEKAGLDGFCAAHPFELHYVPRLKDERANIVTGAYNKGSQRIRLNSTRPTNTVSQGFEPGKTGTVSMSGKSEHEAMSITLVHEVGHHVINVGGDTIESVVEGAFFDRAKSPVTVYARGNPEDYFCESLAAYVFHHEKLKEFDQVGYNMVEQVLRMIGAKR